MLVGNLRHAAHGRGGPLGLGGLGGEASVHLVCPPQQHVLDALPWAVVGRLLVQLQEQEAHGQAVPVPHGLGLLAGVPLCRQLLAPLRGLLAPGSDEAWVVFVRGLGAGRLFGIGLHDGLLSLSPGGGMPFRRRPSPESVAGRKGGPRQRQRSWTAAAHAAANAPAQPLGVGRGPRLQRGLGFSIPAVEPEQPPRSRHDRTPPPALRLANRHIVGTLTATPQRHRAGPGVAKSPGRPRRTVMDRACDATNPLEPTGIRWGDAAAREVGRRVAPGRSSRLPDGAAARPLGAASGHIVDWEPCERHPAPGLMPPVVWALWMGCGLAGESGFGRG